MTDTNDGLGGAPIPAPRDPPRPPRGPDLALDTVRDSLLDTANKGAAATKKWEKMIDTAAAHQDGAPSFKPFIGNSADPTQAVESKLESVIGADPSMLGLLKGLGGGMLTMISHPVSSATDSYQVSKIRDLQAKFFKDHDGVLRDLSEDHGKAKIAMRALANLMDGLPIEPSTLERIMREKRAAGDRVRRQIDAGLKGAKTPEEKQKLEAMKTDMDKWTAERDQRLKAEEPAYNMVRDKADASWNAISEQRHNMRSAADSPGPTTTTGGTPNHVLETTHTQPDAALHVASLHSFLLQARAQIGGR